MVLAEPSVITQHVAVFHEREDLMEEMTYVNNIPLANRTHVLRWRISDACTAS